MIVMGYEDDEKKEAKYSLITSDGEDTYIMEIKFIDTKMITAAIIIVFLFFMLSPSI